MTSAKTVFLVGITLVYSINIVASTPWLHKNRNSSSLFSFASSASTVSSTTESHIADLRKKAEKSAQLQQDKEIVQQEDLADDEDDESSGDDVNIEVNEASPSFIRKKVSKILAKLRLIAQIKNAYHASKGLSKHHRNLTFSITPSKNSTDHQIKSAEDTEEFEVESIAPQSQNIQQIYRYSGPSERLILPNERIDEPTKVAVEVNEINDKVENIDKPDTNKAQEPEPSRFGPLGVFFAELFGTLVGLTYGAVTQLTSGNQSPVVQSTLPAST
ncbi:uncharacterized protein LOC143194302 [Rhynchophorus ferrugineus]|uniref:uncharacterized protein LOC143194302 n=1 Tax=Rhynchophorus ferrugineus TaxID=354439 RepID=UPI003FCE97F4